MGKFKITPLLLFFACGMLLAIILVIYLRIEIEHTKVNTTGRLATALGMIVGIMGVLVAAAGLSISGILQLILRKYYWLHIMIETGILIGIYFFLRDYVQQNKANSGQRVWIVENIVWPFVVFGVIQLIVHLIIRTRAKRSKLLKAD